MGDGITSYLLYRSQARIPERSRETVDMIARSQRNNAEHRITGCLYRESDLFFQWIEGPAEAIDALLTRLMADERHCDLEVLVRGQQRGRQFSDWSLGYAETRGVSLFDFIAEHGQPGSDGEVATILEYLRGLDLGTVA